MFEIIWVWYFWYMWSDIGRSSVMVMVASVVYSIHGLIKNIVVASDGYPLGNSIGLSSYITTRCCTRLPVRISTAHCLWCCFWDCAWIFNWDIYWCIIRFPYGCTPWVVAWLHNYWYWKCFIRVVVSDIPCICTWYLYGIFYWNSVNLVPHPIFKVSYGFVDFFSYSPSFLHLLELQPYLGGRLELIFWTNFPRLIWGLSLCRPGYQGVYSTVFLQFITMPFLSVYVGGIGNRESSTILN